MLGVEAAHTTFRKIEQVERLFPRLDRILNLACKDVVLVIVASIRAAAVPNDLLHNHLLPLRLAFARALGHCDAVLIQELLLLVLHQEQ